MSLQGPSLVCDCLCGPAFPALTDEHTPAIVEEEDIYPPPRDTEMEIWILGVDNY